MPRYTAPLHHSRGHLLISAKRAGGTSLTSKYVTQLLAFNESFRNLVVLLEHRRPAEAPGEPKLSNMKTNKKKKKLIFNHRHPK